MAKIIPVILCGGSGMRLWPLSRSNTPKQFLRLLGSETLLQKTARRALGVARSDDADLVVVTLDSMREETTRQLAEISPGLGRHVLGEPEARNTAAAVAYASLYVKAAFGDDALMWVMPSDHHIGDESNLSLALQEAAEMARAGYLVVFGITPTRPESGYGYIRAAGRIPGAAGYHVARFVEKPTHERAAQYIASGEYLWNSGMHVFSAKTVGEAFLEYAPGVWRAVESAMRDGRPGKPPSPGIYARVEKMPFETAVLEKAAKISVVPCDPEWSDIGSWESLWEINPKNQHGNATNGRVICEETVNSFIVAQERLVTCIGVKDIVIIETGDSVLVADRKCNGSMKKLVSTLQQNGHKEVHAMIRAGTAA